MAQDEAEPVCDPQEAGGHVAVWRRTLLQGSETFIRGQVSSLPSWEASLFGTERVASPLSRPDDFVLFDGNGLRDKLGRRWFRLVRRSGRLERAIRASGADVIHAHFMRDAWDVLPTARRLRLPLVVTAHGFDVTSWVQVKGIEGRLRRRRVRRIGRQSALVIAVSQFIRKTVVDLGVPSDKVVVRYIGIDTGPRLSSSEVEPTELIFVGRLVAKKGVMDLLEAMHRSRRSASLRLAIVGDGHLRAALEQRAADLGLDVRFLGSLDPAGVASNLGAADIFVAPSKTAEDGDSEGFGMVFLEAALAGLPVVAYAHGGVQEAVHDRVTGLLVREGDLDALAEAIDELLDDPFRATAMGQAGAERVIREFDLRQRTGELEGLYVSVAHQGP